MEELKTFLMKRAGITYEELENMLEKKRKEMGDLLEGEALIYAVAKDLGLDAELDRTRYPLKKLGEISEGDQGIRVRGRVIRVYDVRLFKKGERTGRYVRILLEDESGRAYVTLWHRDVNYVTRKKIVPGTELELINAYVTRYRDNLNVSVGVDGRILVERRFTPLSSLEEGYNNVRVQVVGRVGKRKYYVAEGDTYIPLLLWQEGELETGKSYIIMNARFKEGALHVGDNSYLEETEEVEVSFRRCLLESCEGLSRVRGYVYKQGESYLLDDGSEEVYVHGYEGEEGEFMFYGVKEGRRFYVARVEEVDWEEELYFFLSLMEGEG